MAEVIICMDGSVYCTVSVYPVRCTLWQDAVERCKNCPLRFLERFWIDHPLAWNELTELAKRGGTVVPPSDSEEAEPKPFDY